MRARRLRTADRGLVLAAWPAARPARAALVVVEAAPDPTRRSSRQRWRAVAALSFDAPADASRACAGGRAARLATEGCSPAALGTAVPPPSQAGPSPDEATIIRVGTLQAGGMIRSLALENAVARVLAGEAAHGRRRPPSKPWRLRHAASRSQIGGVTRRRLRPVRLDTLSGAADGLCGRKPPRSATAGQVLEWHGAPAAVYYTASCGGRTERRPRCGRGPPTRRFYRRAGIVAVGGEPRWASELSAAEVQRALVAAGYSGSLKRVKIRRRADSGRVAVLALDGMTPDAISGQDFRMAIGRTLGWQILKSTAFELGHRRGRYTFKGRGYGHGVGFCVIGAMRRAAAGASRPAPRCLFPRGAWPTTRTLRLPAPLPVPPGHAARARQRRGRDDEHRVAWSRQQAHFNSPAPAAREDLLMIHLFDQDTGARVGTITEDQLQFLIDLLEELSARYRVLHHA